MNKSDISSQRNDGCLIRGNPREFFGWAIVCYIDILGISLNVRDNWGEHYESAHNKLLRIKEHIPTADEHTQAIFAICDPKTNREFERYLSITRTWSDSIVTMLAFPNSPTNCDSQEFSTRVISVLYALRFIWRQSLREGFTIRGGIEFGEMFWNDTDFIGPALVNAYKLENKMAHTSRILIGPTLLNIIIEFSNVSSKVSPDVQSLIDAFLVSGDHKIFVNPHFAVGKDMIGILEALCQKASADSIKIKYHNVIEILKIPEGRLSHPTLDEIRRCITLGY